MGGMNKVDPKLRREQRRRNHIARDLHKSKYHQRVIEDKRRKSEDDWEDEDA